MGLEMTVTTKNHLMQGQIFGRNNVRSDSLEQMRVRRALLSRLESKAENYDRAAARLELRGETDAAKVLVKASRQLRDMIVAAPAERE
jgi:hypothetical protein